MRKLIMNFKKLQMRSLAVGLGLILFMLLFSGCQEAEQDGPASGYVTTDDEAVYLSTDQDVLSDHLQVDNSALEIDTTPYSTSSSTSIRKSRQVTRAKGSPVNDVALSLIAETNASQVSGLTLQATDVGVKDKTAYVSFNQAGDVFAGAIQVISIRREQNPEILAELLFSDMDINAVYLRDNTLYAVGAADTSSRDLTSPAVLLIIPLSRDVPGTQISLIDLPSYAGTDVLVKGNTIFATVGAEGGGLVRISDQSPENFDDTYDFYEIDDARSLAVENNTLGVLKGTDGKILYFDTSDLLNESLLSASSTKREIDLPGTATIANSKSTIDLVNKVTFTALGDGGTKAFITGGSDDSTLIDLPAVNGTASLTADKTVTNAVSAYKDLLFRANGEAGVDLFRLSGNVESIDEADSVTTTRIGSISFESLASANGLYYRKGFLFVADGLGGMKIIAVDRNVSKSTDEDEDDEEEDQDEEDNDDNN